MPALDLSLNHRTIRRATDVLHVLAGEPFRQVRCQYEADHPLL
jgi:hypothetical protein